MDNFQDEVVIVSGAGSGIGRAVALNFASKGAHVCACDISQPNLDALKIQIEERYGSRCLCSMVDVSDHEQVDNFVGSVLSTYKKIDILVNCAGILQIKKFLEMTVEDWTRMLAVHLNGTFFFAKAVANPMRENGSGCIINIGSTSGITGGTSGAHYAAAKGAIHAFSKSLAKELAPYGIRVNVVAPSKIDTRMLEFTSEEEKNKLLSKIPLGRIGTPEEIAEIISFLASDKAEYIVGSVLIASGGY